jgi:imidazolonepropionase-like amidohydrolase
MKSRHATLDPTMAIFKGLLLSRPGQTVPGDEAWLGHMPVSLQRAWRTAALDVKPEQDAAYRASWKKLSAVLKLLDQEGVNLVPGTDNLPGLGLHGELETWVESGIPAARVLKYATLGAARHIGLDPRLGLLKPGHPADLLLVPGDPTTDISVLRKVRLVMSRGATYFPEEIHRAIGIEPFASRPPMVQPASP